MIQRYRGISPKKAKEKGVVRVKVKPGIFKNMKKEHAEKFKASEGRPKKPTKRYAKGGSAKK